MAATILLEFESIQFSVLPCDLGTAVTAIRKQGNRWGKSYDLDQSAVRDIGQIYRSPNGPAKMPAVVTGMLLSEIEGTEGLHTLFVSSVRDGYSSMIHCVSREIPGKHLSVRASRSDVAYPIAEFVLIEGAETKRLVRAMREESGWDFLQTGTPAAFEDVSFYEAPRARDRLTPEVIALYLNRFGYGSLSFDYWTDENASAHLLCEEGFGAAPARAPKH